jgi:hypothetical protein
LTEAAFCMQVADTASRYFGGVISQELGIPRPSHTGTASVIGSWVCAYVNPDSNFFHQEALAKRIDHALDYMLKQQHEDGTISPGWTNYHSPPDTGFVVTGFAHIYQLLVEDNSASAISLSDKVRTFLQSTIPAMLTGGGHTPNHRWVLTSALCHLHAIFGDTKLVERAEAWLSEGIDITNDGEWTERSNGIYNSVSDIFLYHTARLLQKPELLDHIRRNLDMMQYLVHPDGEIVTDYSGRQDFGNTFDLSPYHLICRLMAYHDNNSLYAAMADMAAASIMENGPVNNHIMIGYLVFPFIREQTYENTTLPTEYEIMINETFPLNANLQKANQTDIAGIEHSSMHASFGAPVVRYRKDDESATIMSKNASVFSLRKGEAKLLGFRVSSSFSPGIIEFDTIEKVKWGYRLRKRMEKGYKGPIPSQHLLNTEETSVWYLLPHQHRKLTHNQQFEVEINIYRTNNTWKIHLKSDATEDVLMQAEFLFDRSCLLQGNAITTINEHSSFWKSDELTCTGDKGNYFCLKSGEHKHWMEHIGVQHEVKDVTSVKVNLISPIDKCFEICMVEES